MATTTTNGGPDGGPIKLGFAVKVMGAPDLKSNDARRWQSGPHLRTSLEYVRAILDHLDKHDIRMYRMSSDLAPYVTHPDLPQFHGQIAECDAELREFGRVARERGIRLSFHPSQFIVLNSPDPALVKKSIADLLAQAEMLDRMEQGPEAVIVVHAGGTYGDRVAGGLRWAETFPTLPEPVRRRLVLENDDLRYSAADVLAIHERTGVPLIFDHQHYWCHNPERLDLRETVERFAKTWPKGVRPKFHYSSPRTEMREMKRKDRKTGKPTTVLMPPVWTGHADFVNPFEFVTFLRIVDGIEFDIMLEAKSKDLALLRVRKDLIRYAPEMAPRFGLDPGAEVEDAEPVEAEAGALSE
ncbi:UV DNA damage repair endonuclease UvsE [Tundrisphaera sp. TA3]|uniref:UV DNA damage repair endonuclease UvsE n=1 Tax=Tundrisphaera sp. TA3 TaxID=3435775 RepID=UPI003EBB110E